MCKIIKCDTVVRSQPCLTLSNPMDWDMPHLPVLHHLLELAQTHAHWVRNAIQLSHSRSSPSPPAFNLSQHQALFHRVHFLHQVAKVLELSFSIRPSNEYSGLISFRIDWFDLFAVQGTLRIHYFKTAPLYFNVYLPGELHFLSFFFKEWLLFTSLFSYLRCNLIEPEVNKRPSLHKFCSQRNWSWNWEISNVERWRT